jgi:hypothetical protein
MPLSALEFKSVREHLLRAREHVENAFSTVHAGGASTIARSLRDIHTKIEHTIADLDTLRSMQAAVKRQPPSNGGGDE